MAITKLTFDEALNSAKSDAFFNYYLTNKKNGIFRDLGGACEATTSGGKITFKDGFVSVYGRRIYVENNTSINVPLTAERKGYVIIKVDTRNNEAKLELLEGTSTSYPTLKKDDLLAGDGEYDFILVGYKKTTSSITLDRSVIGYIDTNKTELDGNVSTLNGKIDANDASVRSYINGLQHGMKSVSIGLPSVNGKVYKFSLSTVSKIQDYIIYFACAGNVISIPSCMLSSSTSISFSYTYFGTNYDGFLEKSADYLFITVGDVSHKIKRIHIIY